MLCTFRRRLKRGHIVASLILVGFSICVYVALFRLADAVITSFRRWDTIIVQHLLGPHHKFSIILPRTTHTHTQSTRVLYRVTRLIFRFCKKKNFSKRMFTNKQKKSIQQMFSKAKKTFYDYQYDNLFFRNPQFPSHSTNTA